MLKVLIADDDFWVREGLKSTIDWNEIGYEIAGEAEDADKAYELYRELSPHVVITDIRMKHTNGLDLVEKIHSEGSDTEIIILSGYSQFDYAKRAYENGSAAYLLKPVDNAEIVKLLVDLKEKIEEKNQPRRRLNLSQSEISSLKTAFFNGLIYDDLVKEEIEQMAFDYGIDSFFTPHVVINAELSKIAVSDLEQSNKVHTDIMESFRLFGEEYPALAEFWIFSKLNVLAVIRAEEGAPSSSDLEPLQKIFFERTGKSLAIGVSTVYDCMTNLRDAYLEACNALSFKSLYGNNAIIFYQDTLSKKSTKIFIDNSTVDELVHAIFEIDYNKAFSVSEEIFKGIRTHEHVEITNMQNAFAELISIITRSVYKDKQSMLEVFSEGFHPFTEIQDCGTVTEIETYFNRFLDKIFENPNVYMECSYNPQVQQIIAYIVENYALPLTVEGVAKEHHLSASYFMLVFKQETGKTFHAYLTEYRMKIAAQLLKNPNYKIYEVAHKVGYTNPEQFAKIFKSITGHTPTKYRSI